MTTLKPSYGSVTSVTITTSALATDANLLAGRQSNAVNNTSDLAVDSLVGFAFAAPGSAPTANTQIEVWLFGSWNNGTTYSAGAGASDANLSLATTGVKQTMALAGIVQQTDTTARIYDFGPVSVAAVFGGPTMPDHWGAFIVHNLGVTMGTTTMQYTPVQYTNT